MSDAVFSYKIYLDTKDADAQQKAFEGSMTSTAGVIGRIDGQIKAYERSIELLNKAIQSGAGNQNAYQRELTQIQQALARVRGEASTAAVATASVGGGFGAAGRSVLELSRGLEDLQYGFRGIVNNIPTMVMGLGAGAGVAGAISLAAIAVNQLVENFGKVDPATKEAAEAAKERVRAVRTEIDSLRRELRSLELGAVGAELEAASGGVSAAAKKREEAFKKIGGIREYAEKQVNERIAAGQTEHLSETVKAAIEAQKEYNDAIENVKLRLQIKQEKQAQKEQEDAVANANKITDKEEAAQEKAASAAEAARLSEEKKKEESLRRSEDEFEESLQRDAEKAERHADQINKMKAEKEDEAIRKRKKQQEEEFKLYEKLTGQVRKLLEKQDEESANRISGYVTTATSIVASSSEQLISDLISGQEYALEKFSLSIMAQAGQALVANGIRLIGEATVSGLTGNLPVAAVQAAGGAGLITAGVGLGGVAGGLSANLAKQEAANKKEEKGITRGRSSSSSRSSGGPASINITYGVAGPLPEDTAREIQKALKTNSRRGGR